MSWISDVTTDGFYIEDVEEFVEHAMYVSDDFCINQDGKLFIPLGDAYPVLNLESLTKEQRVSIAKHFISLWEKFAGINLEGGTP